MVDLPRLAIGEKRYEVPATEVVHANLVQAAVEMSEDICIVTPTLRSEYLDYHGLAVLFADMRAVVLAMTPNADVRNRYQYLENGDLDSGEMRFSVSHWPLATVTSDETLSPKTTLAINRRRDCSKQPQFLYCKHSNRLPQGQAADRVDVVLYDEALKFEYERWKRFEEWHDQHDVATVVYFIRDPTGPVAHRIKDTVDTTWAWTPAAVADVLDFDAKPDDNCEATADGGSDAVPAATRGEEQLLMRRARGIDYDLQVQAEGAVAEAFDVAWAAVQNFGDLANGIGAPELEGIVDAARRSVSGHARLLANPKYSLKYRASHYGAIPHKTRIEKLDRAKHGLSGDAGAAFGPLDDLVDELKGLRTVIEETDSAQWKRGRVLTAIKTVLDREESLIVVAPDDAARTALQSDLLIEHAGLWNRATPYVDLHTHQSLPQADSADHLLLYGPPKRSQRWILRTPHARRVMILAYPHELGLLVSQVSHLNGALEYLTPLEATNPRAASDDTGGGSSDDGQKHVVLQQASVPPLVAEDASDSTGSPSRDDLSGVSGTVVTPPHDGISIEIPNEEDVVEFARGDDTTASTQRHDGADNGHGLSDYQLVDTADTEEIDDLIETTVSEYQTEGGDNNVPNIDAETNADDSTGLDSGPSRPRGEITRVAGLIEISTEDGYSIALEPDSDIEVVDADGGATIEKRVTAVQSGEMVVVVHDRKAIRQAIEERLVEAGHFDLVAQARMWHERLDAEIDRQGDDVENFINRLENEGINKTDTTYENWYQGHVTMPRAKKSLRAIAHAYDMEAILENFEDIWDANQAIRKLKNDLIDELKNRLHEALAGGDNDEVLDEELDVRLSDLLEDSRGRPFIERHIVKEVTEDVERPKSHIGTWRA